MFDRKSVAAAAVAFGFVMATAPSDAAAQRRLDRMVFFTFSGSVALPGVALPAGTYAFQIADPTDSGDIVRVSSSDLSRVLYQGFTQRVSRPSPEDRVRLLVLGEVPRGTPPPIRVWFPTGEALGHQFVYEP